MTDVEFGGVSVTNTEPGKAAVVARDPLDRLVRLGSEWHTAAARQKNKTSLGPLTPFVLFYPTSPFAC